MEVLRSNEKIRPTEASKPLKKKAAYLLNYEPGVIEFILAQDQIKKIDYLQLKAKLRSITKENRVTLIEWLMEICDQFQLKRQTYHLAVYYADLFLVLESEIYPIERYQLLGICCLLIACKIEEIYYPKLSEFEYITDSNNTVSDILAFEREIFKTL